MGGALDDARLPPPDLPGLDPAWSRLVEVPDAEGITRRFHLLDHGPSDPVGTLVCVHGNPTWSYLWRSLVARLGDRWRVLAPDQLDMGYSQRTGTVRPLARRIDDLDRLIETVGVTGPVVGVGHDWGGAIVTGWALRRHRRGAGLDALVLTNTALHQPAHAAAPRLIRLVRRPGLLDTVCRRTPVFVRGAAELSRPRLPAPVRAALAAPYGSADRRRAVAEFVADIPLDESHPSFSTLADLAAGSSELDVPVLLVWGGRDPVFSDLYLHDLEQRFPQAQVHRFARAGHLVIDEADVAGVVEAWLQRRFDEADESPAAGPGGLSGGPASGGPASDGPASGGPARPPVWAAIGERARQVPEAEAVVEPAADRSISWAELEESTRALAAGLVDRGIEPGDRVALLVPPGIDLVVALYACWRAGAVVVVADAGLGPRGMTDALRSAAPDHLIGIDRALAAARVLGWPGRRIRAGGPGSTLAGADIGLEELIERGRQMVAAGASIPEPGPEAEAAVLFTSGATGPAKGVVYRQHQLAAQRDALAATYGIGADDRLVAAFAPFALYAPALGITGAVPDMDPTAPASLTAEALAAAVSRVQATLVFASPAALASVVAGARGPLGHGVRLLLSAGAPVPAETLRAARGLFPGSEAHTPYGMTEALPTADISLAEIDAAGPGDGVCVGRAVPGVELALDPLDASGRPSGRWGTPVGVLGELLVRAEHTKERYDRRWFENRASDRPLGWHRTGDVGSLDAEGRWWVAGRLSQVLLTEQGPIGPVGAEQRILTLPEITNAALVGVGPAGRQQAVAVVSGPDERGMVPIELADRVREAAGLGLAAVLAVERLPVDLRHNSKIDRAAVGAWAAEVLSGRSSGRRGPA